MLKPKMLVARVVQDSADALRDYWLRREVAHYLFAQGRLAKAEVYKDEEAYLENGESHRRLAVKP